MVLFLGVRRGTSPSGWESERGEARRGEFALDNIRGYTVHDRHLGLDARTRGDEKTSIDAHALTNIHTQLETERARVCGVVE